MAHFDHSDFRALGRIALLAAVCAAPAPPAAAEVRALLVGVGDYRHLDADLKGPPNDVRAMAMALDARGVPGAAMTVLVTGDPGADGGLPPGAASGEPTRAAILAGLDALGSGLGPGDTALFYFSGHGAQAPDASGDEAGGYDEILLPADADRWSGTPGAVANAITDDELRGRAQAILTTGAALVAVLDACHSATGLRAGPTAGVSRGVEGALLGLADADPADEAGPAMAGLSGDLAGEFVFLYSSQSDQRSFEYPLGPEGEWYGAFTRALVGVLQGGGALTYAQWLQATRDAMAQGPGRAQWPEGEGPLLDRAVLGAAAGAGRHRVVQGAVQAGLLQGLTEGMPVALYATAAGGPVLARADLTALTARSARLTLPDGALLPDSAYAEPLAPGRPAPLRLAPPLVIGPAGPDDAALLADLAAIREDDLASGVGFAAPGDAFDAGVVLTGGLLALTGPDGLIDPTGPGSTPRFAPGLSDPATRRADLAQFLDAAARVARLRTALATLSGTAPRRFAAKAGLTVTPTLRASSPAQPCGRAAAAPAPLGTGQDVRQCDQIWLKLANRSQIAQDVTVLYVDAALSVSLIWPLNGLSNRIAFGETQDIGLQISAGARPALEEVIVIATPAAPDAPRTVFDALADDAPTRAGAASPAAAYLAALTSPDASRAFPDRETPPEIAVTRLPVTVLPLALP